MHLSRVCNKLIAYYSYPRHTIVTVGIPRKGNIAVNWGVLRDKVPPPARQEAVLSCLSKKASVQQSPVLGSFGTQTAISAVLINFSSLHQAQVLCAHLDNR